MRKPFFRGWILWIVTLTLGGALARAHAESNPSVALVIKTQGTVQAKAADAHATWEELGPCDEVYTGQTLRVGKEKNAGLLLAWHKGGPQFQLAAGAMATVSKDGLTPRSGPPPLRLTDKTSSVTYQVKGARRPGEGIGASTQRGGPEGRIRIPTRIYTPLGALYEPPTQLKWWSVATKAHVSILRAGSNTPLWKQNFKDSANTVRFPTAKVDIKPGKAYGWIVEAEDEDGSTDKTEVAFWLLDPKVKAYLDSLRDAAKDHPDDTAAHIFLIRALWDAGRFEEAADTAREYAKTQPEDASLNRVAERLAKRFEEIANGGEQDLLKTKWSTNPNSDN